MATQPAGPEQESEPTPPGMGHLTEALVIGAGILIGLGVGSQDGAIGGLVGAAVGAGGGILASHVLNSIFKR